MPKVVDKEKCSICNNLLQSICYDCNFTAIRKRVIKNIIKEIKNSNCNDTEALILLINKL